MDGTEENVVILREEDIELTKYIFRQRTQQHLYAAKEFINKKKNMIKSLINEVQSDNIINEKNNLKQTLVNYLTEIKKYMNDNNLSDDLFYKNLCDDIYISIQTFNTHYGEMYVKARLTSQGTQRAYNVTNIPEQINFNGSIRRQNALCHNLDVQYDEDNDITLEHNVSSCVKSPYRSSSQTGVMRAVSNNITNIENEDESEFTLPV